MAAKDGSSVSRDDFPYKRLQGDMQSDIRRRFLALMQWRPTFVITRYNIVNAPELEDKHLRFCFGGQRDPMVMSFSAADYDKYNLISDYFIEQHRIRAIRGDDPKHESLFDYWGAHRDEIRAKCDESRSTELPPQQIIGVAPRNENERRLICYRERVYADKMEVGTFRPTVAAGIIWLMRKRLGQSCDYVLDPCAGWGDRLIGITAAGARGSVHVDPNPALGAEYARIFDWIREVYPALTAYRREYIARPFEDIPRAELLQALARVKSSGASSSSTAAAEDQAPTLSRDDGFDLVIIAPPYFDLEIYVPNDATGTQSITRYTEWSQWYEKFLLASLALAASTLRIGGVLALIINQPPDRNSPRFLARLGPDVIRAASGVETNPQMRYLGVISYAEYKPKIRGYRSPQPIWIWMRERHR